MWELDQKEGWASENWCFQIVVLEKTLESPLDCREIKLILKEINPEYSLEGLNVKLKLQYFSQLMRRADSLEKTDAGKDWGQEKGMETEDEVVREHHQLNGHEFERTPGDSEGEGSQACCSPGVAKSWTQFSNWTTAITPPPIPLHTVSAERIPVSYREVAYPVVRAWIPITPLSLPCHYTEQAEMLDTENNSFN